MNTFLRIKFRAVLLDFLVFSKWRSYWEVEKYAFIGGIYDFRYSNIINSVSKHLKKEIETEKSHYSETFRQRNFITISICSKT